MSYYALFEWIKPNTNTGVESVAVVAGIAVLATGAVIVAKKRK